MGYPHDELENPHLKGGKIGTAVTSRGRPGAFGGFGGPSAGLGKGGRGGAAGVGTLATRAEAKKWAIGVGRGCFEWMILRGWISNDFRMISFMGTGDAHFECFFDGFQVF